MKNFKKIITNEYFWFSLIILLGIFLRLYKLDAIPPGFTGNEAWLGLDGQTIVRHGWIGIYIPGHAWGYNALHAYISGAIIKLLGSSIFSTRLASAIPGIISLGGFYFLARQFYSTKVSLVLLSLLAISRWHIHFSHLALPGIILIPLFSTLTFLFLFKAFKTKKMVFFILSGIFLGFGLNSYFFFIACFLTACIILFLRIIREKRIQKGFIIFAITVGLIIAPFAYYIIKNPTSLGGKWEARSIFFAHNKIQLATPSQPEPTTFQILAIQTQKTIGGYFLKGDTDEINNQPGIPLLELPLAILFLFGISLAFKNIKKEKNYFLLIWLFLALMMGILTESAPNAKRTLDAINPIFLLIGTALTFLEKGSQKKYVYFSLILIAYSLLVNYKIYFQDYAQNRNVKNRFAFEIVTMCDYFNKNKNGLPYIYFYHPTTYFNYETRRFLCPQLLGEDRSKEYGRFSLENKKKKNVSFVYTDSYKNILPDLIKKYPSGKVSEFKDKNGNLIFGEFLVKNKQ